MGSHDEVHSLPTRFFRWLLQLDRPVPPYTAGQLAAFVERNYRWNATVNLVDGLTYWLGLSLISSSTIVPLFISKLTSSTLPIGLAAMVAQGGWYLPQLFTANWVERLPRRKPAVANLGLVAERLPAWIAALAAILSGKWAIPGLVLFLLAYSWRALGGGALGPAWQDMIARVIPVDRRGRIWGLTSSLGVGFGVAGSLLSVWLLRNYSFPTSFVYIFALAATVITGGWFFLALTREPAIPVTAPRQSQRQFLANLPHLLRQDPPFRRFVVARVLLSLGAMGAGFLTLSAIRRWGVSDSTVGIYTAVLLLGQTAGNLGFGLLADRRGHKLPLEWAALAYCAAFLLAWLAPVPSWYYAVFALLGIATGSVTVSGIMVVLEFCEPERRPTYAGITNTSVGLASIAGPLLATALASIHVGWAFALSAAVSLVAWAVMRWSVEEPRWAATP